MDHQMHRGSGTSLSEIGYEELNTFHRCMTLSMISRSFSSFSTVSERCFLTSLRDLPYSPDGYEDGCGKESTYQNGRAKGRVDVPCQWDAGADDGINFSTDGSHREGRRLEVPLFGIAWPFLTAWFSVQKRERPLDMLLSNVQGKSCITALRDGWSPERLRSERYSQSASRERRCTKRPSVKA